MPKTRQQHEDFIKTELGVEIRKYITEKNTRKLKDAMHNIIVLADYKIHIFQSIISSEELK